MTKEQFIKQAGVIEDYLAERGKAGNVLNDAFFKGSTPSVFDFGDDLINLAIEQLSELSGIHIESLEWYLCESRGVCRYPADGAENKNRYQIKRIATKIMNLITKNNAKVL